MAGGEQELATSLPPPARCYPRDLGRFFCSHLEERMSQRGAACARYSSEPHQGPRLMAAAAPVCRPGRTREGGQLLLATFSS
jgi:hypothetical protein